jgi:hypothetical protein
MIRNIRIVFSDCCTRNAIFTTIDDGKDKESETDRILMEYGFSEDSRPSYIKIDYLD